MQGFNHVAGGLAFAGIFASFTDTNIFEKPEYIATTVFFSLLADIDHTKSPIGKLFYPVAKWLDRKYGHRTITHSLLFYAGLMVICGVLEMLCFGTKKLTFFAALAYGSHLLFDMCTRQGIPLFMPFTSNRCVLPGDPKLRLNTGRNPVPEILLFFGFIGLTFTTAPLMAKGFWTSFNETFADFKHLDRENARSKTALKVKTKDGKTGTVVSTTPNGLVMIEANGSFSELSEGNHAILTFGATSKAKQVQRLEFIDISSDSLRQLLKNPVLSVQAVAKYPIRYRLNGQQFEQSSIKQEYLSGLQFSDVLPDDQQKKDRVLRLETQIETAAELQRQERKMKAAKIANLQNLQAQYGEFSEYEQGKAQEEIARLKADLEKPESQETAEIKTAKAELANLKRYDFAPKNSFTGVVTIWKQ